MRNMNSNLLISFRTLKRNCATKAFLMQAKVSIMFVAESVMITVLCLGLGFGIGNAVSQPVADSLIASQVEAASSAKSDMHNGLTSIGESNTSTSGIQPLSEIDVSLTAEAALQIALIALALALLSSAAGVIFITKYEPMKILSERN